MCPVKFQGQMQGAHLNSSIPLSEAARALLAGAALLFICTLCKTRSLYSVTRDKHQFESHFFVSLLSQIDFRSVGVEDAITLSDTIRGKGFLRSWCFP